MRALVLVLALALAVVPRALAQEDEEGFENRTTPGDFRLQKVEKVHLDDVWAGPDGQRVIELYLRALTRYGEPVENLHAAHIEVREDGTPFDSDDLTVQTLENSKRGITTVLAMDVSRTMTGEPFERAKAAALNFVDRLGAVDRVAVVSFAGAAEVTTTVDMPKQKARVYLDNLQIDPNSLNTVLYDGTYRAIELVRENADIPRRAFVIVFSDGNDGGSNHSLEQAIELAKGNSTQARIPVFTIGYARLGGGGLEVLRRLAAETGGDYFQASSPVHLGAFYKEILKQMLASYVVRVPTSLDGEAHTVEVVIEGQKDERMAMYPDIRPNLWPFAAAGGGVLVLALLVMLLARSRSPGKLVFVTGPWAGEARRLRRGSTRIGAIDQDNDIVIDYSPLVSRYHAEVRANGKELVIEDLRSQNGTLVNGMRIERSPIRAGDRIRIADVDLVLER